jgi:hypothetical protein
MLQWFHVWFCICQQTQHRYEIDGWSGNWKCPKISVWLPLQLIMHEWRMGFVKICLNFSCRDWQITTNFTVQANIDQITALMSRSKNQFFPYTFDANVYYLLHGPSIWVQVNCCPLVDCGVYLCRQGVRSLRYNSMQNAKHDGSLKHTLREPLIEDGHALALHPSCKQYKNTIGIPFRL